MENNSVTSFHKDIYMEIGEGEELLLRCAPNKASYVLSNTVALLPFVIIWLGIDGFAISMLIRTHMPPAAKIFVFVFFALHLLPVWIWIANIVKALKRHKYMEYGLTNKRIIIRSKLYLTSYYYKDLSRAQVRVGLVDRLFKVGDIVITKKVLSGEEVSDYKINRYSISLLDISNPYAVGDKLQQFIDAENQNAAPERKREEDVEYESYYETGNGNIFTKKYNCGKSSSTPKQKTEEDEFLDNIMDTVNKKDEF